MKKYILFSLIIICSLSSCKNDAWSYPDYEYSTVYFSYQYPVRVLEMGEDLWDLTLDNQHKCKIFATWGGGYSNPNDVTIDIAIDNSLCDNLMFKNNNKDVIPLPSNYYTLLSDQITISKGKPSGGVEVQFTDAFFADPASLKRTYVIPLVMTKAIGVDSIVSGKANKLDANRCVSADWDVAPKDYTLYAVRYINEWDAYYLKRGIDVVTENGNKETVIRHEKYVEDDKECKLNTMSLSKLEYPLTYKDNLGNNINISLILDFDNDGKCIVSSGTPNVTASGKGEFVKKGEKNSWGNKDRDALYLDYNVTIDTKHYETKDTLVTKTRGIKKELFEVVLK